MNLEKVLIDKTKASIVYFKYLSRVEYKEPSSSTSSSKLLHKYYLKGILNPACTWMDIYCLHFNSCFTIDLETLLKEREDISSLQVKRQNLSKFYRQFLRYVHLHSLFS